MPDNDITFEDQGSKARYFLTVPERDGAAELTVSKLSDSVWIADHTGVPDSLRGTGAGAALLDRLIADARAAGRRIVPLCPYVRAMAMRHRGDWADVILR